MVWIAAGYCGNLLISVRMRATLAPYMSCGSRANQAKPEALPSCSEQSLTTATFCGETRVCACAGYGTLDSFQVLCPCAGTGAY